jgi:secreted PhoX family phosphatase
MARNQRNNSEFAGPAFSADGRTLFVNIYAGWTFAVTGLASATPKALSDPPFI